MDSTEPEELDKWLALEVIEERERYMQAAMVCSAVHNALLNLQRRAGTMLFARIKDEDYTRPEDFVAFDWGKKRKKRPKVMSWKHQEITMRAMLTGM